MEFQTMEQIRNSIDEVDLQIRELLAKRLQLSYEVAQNKAQSGNTTIYRADREAAILENLGKEISDDIKVEYLAIVKKIMETSRMYQYGLLYEWNKEVFEEVAGYELADSPTKHVVVRLSRENRPNAMSAILCMIGDHGYDMKWMELIKCTDEFVTFELTILGDTTQANMRKLLFQLSKESSNFSIVAVEKL
ncbi:MAG: chorismate mutase [Anaerotardibacter sp.]